MKHIRLLLVLGIFAVIPVAYVGLGCPGYEAVLCHTGTVTYGEKHCMNPPPFACGEDYYNIVVNSTTDGNRALECNNSGNLDYCNGDSIPDACHWSETITFCQVDCTLGYDIVSHNTTLNSVNAGGLCSSTP